MLVGGGSHRPGHTRGSPHHGKVHACDRTTTSIPDPFACIAAAAYGREHPEVKAALGSAAESD